MACGIRKAIFDTLGFTLSVEATTSKMMAKLGGGRDKDQESAKSWLKKWQ